MFGSGTQKNGLPLIIVCDDKNMVYANYLIQLMLETALSALRMTVFLLQFTR